MELKNKLPEPLIEDKERAQAEFEGDEDLNGDPYVRVHIVWFESLSP